MSPTSGGITRNRSELRVQFLLDWRDDHRELSDAHRDAAGRYITAIVRRDPRSREDARIEGERADQLWQVFRETYDGLVGPYGHSPQEDFARALGRL